jgi:hypothetical protein
MLNFSLNAVRDNNKLKYVGLSGNYFCKLITVWYIFEKSLKYVAKTSTL